MPDHPPSLSRARAVAFGHRTPSIHRGGFTLIELLVACSIAAIVVSVCFWVMGEMQKQTRMGLARLTILKASEALDGQLRSDFAALVGPSSTPGASAGCLIIIPGVREGYIPTVRGKSANKVRLRSDQLIFFANANQTTGAAATRVFESVFPTDRNDPALKVRSDQARIWIGAVKVDDSDEAQNWCLGRQATLLGRLDPVSGIRDSTFDAPVGNLTVRQSVDTATGTLAAIADSACGVRTLPGGGQLRGVGQRSLGTSSGPPDWTDIATGTYVSNLLGTGIPDDKTKYTNLPSAQANIELTNLRHQGASVPPIPSGGLTMSELNKTVLQLIPNCSEIVIQWAGDLDKDGIIDTYSVGHPLEGAMIWYPEENHTSTAKDAARNAVPSRYSTTMSTKYDAIKAFPWAPPSTTLLSPQTFPAGFTGPSKTRFNGHGDQTATWYRGFEFDYGEADGPITTGTLHGQATVTATSIHVPDPFIFRFEDDQYRLVNYGFRQDGGVYANKHDSKWTPFGGSSHWFPIPPIGTAYSTNSCNPPMSTLYKSINPVAGPYPRTGATAAVTVPVNTNFGDLMGDTAIPYTGVATVFGANPFRTAGGALFNIASIEPMAGNALVDITKFRVSTYTAGAATGTETLWPPASVYRYRSNSLVTFPAVTAANTTYALGIGGAALGTETLLDSAYAYQTLNYGPGNNYTANYRDVITPWLKAVNDVSQQGTLSDWRNPQSDWPRLIRIRVRLHDPQGLVQSYSDEAQCNGRDDDGDGLVDNPEESRISGIWMEYIFALPYPHDPSPRQH